MEHKGVSRSFLVVSEARDDSLCAMYFGISCAFFALKQLSEQQFADQRSLETRDKMLQGSAHLLGLLVWKVQKEEVESFEKYELLHKLEAAEKEIDDLKQRRSEDGKANEKVARIYSAQEQSWFAERRKLHQQIGGLLNDLRILDRRRNDTISELNGKIQEMEFSLRNKDRMIEEEEKRRRMLEEEVKSLEASLEEMKEQWKREAQDHSSEMMKHKTAFIELVSSQRQLEAEFGRALRQVEAAKQQLDFVFEEKEEAILMVQELSMEIEKMRKHLEQKDNILSAVMRKSKLESAEKQVLLKELKSCTKTKRKKAEMETQRWWTVPGSRNERRTLRNMLSRQISSRLLSAETKLDQNDNHFNDVDAEVQNQDDNCSESLEMDLPVENTKFEEGSRLQKWVHSGAEKYHDAVQHQHQVELDVLTEEMQMRDDKLEAYKWRLLSTELESKQLQSQIEGLNQDMSQLRHDNLKLESSLLDREIELKTLRDMIASKLNNLSAQKATSKVKTLKKKAAAKEPETNIYLVEQEAKKEEDFESGSEDTSSTVLSCSDDIKEDEVFVQKNLSSIEISSPEGFETSGKEIAAKMCYSRRGKSSLKLDIQAMGISYKIKRLNQQLIMLERLAKEQDSGDKTDDQGKIRMKGFLLLLSMLNKQVSRYQSLQEKTDDLRQRMGQKDLHMKQDRLSSASTKEDTKQLEHFLEETFQLQRFIVATGQKLIEVQTKIASGFVGISKELNCSASFDMKRYADTIQTLFKDVQRGLEVRISRLIGDLGGTLACDGIQSWK